MNRRTLGVLAMSVAVTTALWIVLTFIQEMSAPTVNNLQEKIESMSNLNFH